MWGINGPNIIICTGLIYALLDYLIEYRDGAHQRVDIPGAWNGDKVQRFWSQFIHVCHLFYVHRGLRITLIFRRNKSFFSLLSPPPLPLHPFLPSFLLNINILKQSRSVEKDLSGSKIPSTKYSGFFPDTLNLYHQRKVCWLWNCKIIVYCELWILVSEVVF